MSVFSFRTVYDMTDALCDNFHRQLTALNLQKIQINLAFSGGNTPGVFFERLATDQGNPIRRNDWNKVHIFWVDERCVAPDHPESNYSMTERLLLRPIGLNDNQVHRIRGENEPEEESTRYSQVIRNMVGEVNDIPVFDWIFLGVGEDGHTASLFPDRPDLLRSSSIYAVARHPVSGQFRVTMTGPVIIKAERITFLVTGQSKSKVIRQIMNNEPDAAGYPAFFIKSAKRSVDWYLDASASEQLKIKGRDKHQEGKEP